MEKGYPKTSFPQQWQQQIILSCLGSGDNGPTERLVGGREGESWTKGLSPRMPPPPLPSAPHKVLVFVPAPGLGGTGHLSLGSRSTHHFAVCQQHLSESLVFLPAKSHKYLL